MSFPPFSSVHSLPYANWKGGARDLFIQLLKKHGINNFVEMSVEHAEKVGQPLTKDQRDIVLTHFTHIFNDYVLQTEEY